MLEGGRQPDMQGMVRAGGRHADSLIEQSCHRRMASSLAYRQGMGRAGGRQADSLIEPGFRIRIRMDPH